MAAGFFQELCRLMSVDIQESSDQWIHQIVKNKSFSENKLKQISILFIENDLDFHGHEDVRLFWDFVDTIVSVINEIKISDGKTISQFYLLLVKELKDYSGLLFRCASQKEYQRRERILSELGQTLSKNGLVFESQSVNRQLVQMSIQGGNWKKAFTGLDGTLGWLWDLRVRNMLQQAECLENHIHQKAPGPDRSVLNDTINALLYEAQVPLTNATASLKARLFHSVALLQLITKDIVLASKHLESAFDTLSLNKNYISSGHYRDADFPDTCLMVLATILRVNCELGNLAQADKAYVQGNTILAQMYERISAGIRFVFRQNAAGYMYRIGNFVEAERIYRAIYREDRQGKITGPSGYAAVLSSRALIWRQMGYSRRSQRYHQMALDCLEKYSGSITQIAKTRIHLATALIQNKEYLQAEYLLDESKTIFSRLNDSENILRINVIQARLLCLQEKHSDALKLLTDTIEYALKHDFHYHELMVTIYSMKASLEANQGKVLKCEQAVIQANAVSKKLKKQFLMSRGRMMFARMTRKALIDTMNISTRSTEQKINTMLAVIENDRADLFADSLSYFVKMQNNSELDQLYLTFLEIQNRYLECRRSIRSYDQSINLENELDTVNEKLGKLFQSSLADREWIEGEQVTCFSLLEGINKLKNPEKNLVVSYLLDQNSLHVSVIASTGKLSDPILEQYHIGPDAPVKLKFSIEERLKIINERIVELRDYIEQIQGMISDLPHEIQPEELSSMKHTYRQLSRLVRRGKYKNNSLHLLVESCQNMISLSFFLLKLCAVHPEFRQIQKSVHKMDQIAFETLYDILVRPINHYFRPSIHVSLLVSDLLSRIPFEALIDSEKPLPDAYAVFDVASFNYFRSPWLMTHSLNSKTKTKTDTENRFLSLFMPLEPETHQQKDAYCFSELNNSGRENKKLVYKFLSEKNATRQAFYEFAPESEQILIESHSSFDRLQPFLSRLMFAEGEPLTAIEIFARYAFDITSLMILVACETDQIYDIELENIGVSIAEVLVCKGVDRIVSPMWSVERRSSRELIRRFVKFQKAAGKTEPVIAAFTKAVREQLRMRGSHPYYWAGFKYCGKP